MSKVNFMQNYSKKGEPLYELFEIIQRQIRDKTFLKFDVRLVNEAKQQIKRILDIHDRTTPQFDEDLNHYYFGVSSPVKTILIVSGKLELKKGGMVHSAFPFELDREDIDKRRLSRGRSLDSNIADILTLDYLVQSKIRKRFLDQGFEKFHIAQSRYFYLREEDPRLDFFRDSGGKVDIPKLTPYIAPITDLLIDKKVKRVSKEEFLEHSPIFTTERQKESITDKSLDVLLQGKVGQDADALADWVANRIVVNDEAIAYKILSYLQRYPIIGENQKSVFKEGKPVKDYIRKPKETGYKALNTRFIVETAISSGGKNSKNDKKKTKSQRFSVMREIQVTPREDYYHNVISIDDKRSELVYTKSRRKDLIMLEKIDEALADIYKEGIRGLFGNKFTTISIRYGRIIHRSGL